MAEFNGMEDIVTFLQHAKLSFIDFTKLFKQRGLDATIYWSHIAHHPLTMDISQLHLARSSEWVPTTQQMRINTAGDQEIS